MGEWWCGPCFAGLVFLIQTLKSAVRDRAFEMPFDATFPLCFCNDAEDFVDCFCVSIDVCFGVREGRIENI